MPIKPLGASNPAAAAFRNEPTQTRDVQAVVPQALNAAQRTAMNDEIQAAYQVNAAAMQENTQSIAQRIRQANTSEDKQAVADAFRQEQMAAGEKMRAELAAIRAKHTRLAQH
jgi:lysophospholipase L1-like esterase